LSQDGWLAGSQAAVSGPAWLPGCIGSEHLRPGIVTQWAVPGPIIALREVLHRISQFTTLKVKCPLWAEHIPAPTLPLPTHTLHSPFKGFSTVRIRTTILWWLASPQDFHFSAQPVRASIASSFTRGRLVS
jgi:hypothetical protein